jgi:hypothetical protein
MDSITLQRLQQPVQVNTTSNLMLEIWSRAQTRIIQDLHLQAHRHRNHTWETVHRDTAKINLLNRLSTAIMSGILAVNREQVERITLNNKAVERKTHEQKRIPEEETQEENRIQEKNTQEKKSTPRIQLRSSPSYSQGNHQYYIRKTANVLNTSSLKKKILRKTRSNRPVTRSQNQ